MVLAIAQGGSDAAAGMSKSGPHVCRVEGRSNRNKSNANWMLQHNTWQCDGSHSTLNYLNASKVLITCLHAHNKATRLPIIAKLRHFAVSCSKHQQWQQQ